MFQSYINTQDPTTAAGDDFRSQWLRRCEFDNAIDIDLAKLCCEFVESIAINPYSHEIEGYPIREILNWKHPSRDWQIHRPHDFGSAVVFANEDGRVWQVRPQHPRINNRGRTIKYESPAGGGAIAYRPPVTAEIFGRVAGVAGVTPPASVMDAIAADRIDHPESFWAWVQGHPSVPLGITEGATKSLSLLTQGIAATSLYGVWSGLSRVGEDRPIDSNGKRIGPDRRPKQLIPELAAIARGRTIYLFFDQDADPNTRDRVSQAAAELGDYLAQYGAIVKHCRWDPSKGKGIDDAIAAGLCPIEAMAEAIDHATFRNEFWYQRKIKKIKARPRMRADEVRTGEYVGSITEAAANHRTVIIDAATGRGKTEAMAGVVRAVRAAMESEREPGRLYAGGYRNTLQRGLALRLDLDFQNDCDSANGSMISPDGRFTDSISGCFDSILGVPNRLPLRLAIYDEPDQTFTHLINGGTCSKHGLRGKRIDRFVRDTKQAEQILLGSATLSQAEVDLIEAITGERPYIIRHEYKAPGYKCKILAGTPGIPGSQAAAKAEFIRQVQAAIVNGDRTIVATDELRTTKYVEAIAIDLGLVDSEILLINGETSSEAAAIEFGEDPNQYLRNHPEVKLIIHNSSLVSGVSIKNVFPDSDGWAEGVYEWIEGSGALDPDKIVQTLRRDRGNCDRVVYMPYSGRTTNRFDATNKIEYRGQKHRFAQLQSAAIGANLDNIDIDSAIARYEEATGSEHNRKMKDLLAETHVAIERDGHEVAVQWFGRCDKTDKQILKYLTQIKKDTKKVDTNMLVAAAAIDDLEAQKLRDKQGNLRINDRRRLEKYEIEKFYSEALTTDLAHLDAGGRYRAAITRIEAIAWDGLSRAIDSRKMEKMAGHDIQPGDLPTLHLYSEAAIALGIHDLVSRAIESHWTGESDWVVAFKRKCLQFSGDIKLALGFTVRQDMNAAAIVGMVLRSLGLATTSVRRQAADGSRYREYAIDTEALETLRGKLLARSDRHISAGYVPRPHALYMLLYGGGGHALSDPPPPPPPPPDRPEILQDGHGDRHKLTA